MKIMQIMPEFGLAGAEIMCENLSYELAQRGNEMILVSLYTYHSAITDRLEREGIRIVYLGKKSGIDISIYRKLDNLIQREKPDVIHTHRYVMQYSVPIGAKYHIGMVHTVHNVAEKEQEWGKRKLSYLFYKFANVTPVALSKEIQKTVCKEYCLKEEKVPIVYNGEDLSKFNCKHDYKFVNKFKIIHIGRFMEVKNHLYLINEIIELLRSGFKIELFLLGDDNNSIGEECKKRVTDSGFQQYIHFEGVQDRVQKYLEAADVFVLPSKYEGIPMSIIEAMACGLPIIASNVGGISDMLENNKSGLLIGEKCEGFKEAIKELYYDGNKRTKLGMGAYKASKKFSVGAMADGYEDVYANILRRVHGKC